ncbi:MFS general substrate transporter [Aspergillus taichungensis]|uniref:MFS general substrate transporter n=1 Tax=Aspergillus taichungensis TaxID=482145 RepID=A0A2J5HY20_9EURO|nr:MFS general substrate transporter [Aspergillus taichungensis]
MAVPDDSSILTQIKQSRLTVANCLASASGIVLYGYDLAIVGNVSSMPAFQRDYGSTLHGKLIIPSMWLSLWNVANPIGGIIGSVTAGFVQDRRGRRFALALAAVISAIGVSVAYVSNLSGDIDTRRGVFFLAKFVQGFAVNMVMCTVQTYMSEVLPRTLRGPILSFFPLFTLIGQLIGSVVVKSQAGHVSSIGYRRCFISEWPFSAIPLVVAILIPESPTYLIRKDLIDDARHAQRRLSGAGAHVESKIDELRLSIRLEEEQAHNHPATYRECFRGTNLRRTIIVLYANAVPVLFGMVLLARASYFLQIVGMDADNSLMCLEVGIGIGLAANILSLWMLSRFGRVPLLLTGLGIATVLWTAMGIAGCFSGIVTVWWTAAMIWAVIGVCGSGAWPASYAVSAEASSLRLRAKTQGLGWLMNCFANGVFGIVLPYIFNPDEGNLRARTGFVYTGLCIVTGLGVWFFIPEMKNRSAIEIDQMFERRLPARQFKRWAVVDESDAESGEGRRPSE